MKKQKKPKKAAVQKKEILEFYLMLPVITNVKEISDCLSIDSEQIELWNELDLMEVILKKDSLIFQNAEDVFEDPEDLSFIQEHNFRTLYQISYEREDHSCAKSILKEILETKGGMLCSDTDDFQPSFQSETINQL